MARWALPAPTSSRFFLVLSIHMWSAGGMSKNSMELVRHASTLRVAHTRAPLNMTTMRPKEICIVGGGLAGLSTAFHLLDKSNKASAPIRLTVIDKAQVGTAGASSVAGGLVHPLSPRGKLVHWGREGLEATNRLVEASSKHNSQAIMRNELYRVALTSSNREQLQQTAIKHPEFCEWLDSHELDQLCGTKSLGGLRLTEPCRVLHVPSYLEGLWATCQSTSAHGSTTDWIVDPEASKSTYNWKTRLDQYDAVVLSAGSALWQDHILVSDTDKRQEGLPVDLIRGQSIEMAMPLPADTNLQQPRKAVLCGKYISPLLDDSAILIGATHEFQSEALPRDLVASNLRERSYELAPELWEKGTIRRTTCGYRVQTRRGALGRMPIVGRLGEKTDLHRNAWIFTGLSSRGLLYHGIYGDVLADAILEQNEKNILLKYPHLNWWREANTERDIQQ